MLRRIAIGLILAMLSSGCAMKAYEGPELTKSEIAVLNGLHRHGGVLSFLFIVPLPAFKHVTRIIEIDGKERRVGRQIHVLPGKHTARVHYLRKPNVTLCGGGLFGGGCIEDYETRDLSIDFVAEAGHEYRIPAERRGERNWIWSEDVMSGNVVAGEKPLDNMGEEKDAEARPIQPWSAEQSQ